MHIRSRQLAKLKGVNSLHLNHRSLLLVDEAKIHEVVVEIKVKQLLELVLDPQILGAHHKGVGHDGDKSQPHVDDNQLTDEGYNL